MRAFTVCGERSPKGRYLDSRSQTRELMTLLLELSKGRKYWSVRFSNCDLRYLFLRISFPILVRMRSTTYFSPSDEVFELSTLALYSTILKSSGF
jgi:hypothetical protein